MNTTTNQNTAWHPVTKATRASHSGTLVLCPCGQVSRVYHFAWCALGCSTCGEMVDKADWKVTKAVKNNAPHSATRFNVNGSKA